MAPIVDVKYEAEQFYGSTTNDLANGQELVSRYGHGGSPMKAIEVLEDQDDNGSKFKSRTRSLTHHLLSQGSFSKHSSFIVVPPLVANPQLLLILELDTHVGACSVSDEFHKNYFENSID